MKKVISIFLLLMFAFSVTSFADAYDDFLTSNYNNYSAKVSVTMSVNEPMEIMNIISEVSGAADFVNLKELCETLCDSTVSGMVKLDASKDYQKIRASYEMYSVVPIKVNRNLKSTNELAFAMWLDWDISDEMNPKMEYIMSVPVSDKYIVMDLAEMLKRQGVSVPQFVSVMKNYLNPDYINKMNKEIAEIFRNNSTVKAPGMNAKITVTSEELENIIIETFALIQRDMEENEEINLLYGEGYKMPFSRSVLEDFFDKVDLFDETALVFDIRKTSGGNINSASAQLNMALDMSELAESLDIEIPKGAASSKIRFSVKEEASYTLINGTSVTFPAITDENSVSVSNLGYDGDYDWNGENCPHDEWVYTYGAYVPESDGRSGYVNLNSFIGNGYRYGYDYDLKINGDSITLKDLNGKERFSEAKMTLSSNKIYVDSVEYVSANPVVNKNGAIYIGSDAVEYIFGAELESYSVDLIENEYFADFERRSPQCSHTDEQIDSWYYEDEDYCDHYLSVWVSNDYPYDGVHYVPLRSVCQEIYNYDDSVYGLSCEGNAVTLADNSGNEKFSTVVFTVGSDEVIIDGAVFKAKHPVEALNGVLYVDDSVLAEIFGLEMTYANMVYDFYSYDEDTGESFKTDIPKKYIDYSFKRKNPACTHTDEEIGTDILHSYR